MSETPHTSDALRRIVLEALTGVAPDIEAESVDPGVPIRDQFDFDSMDQLNFAIALHERLGVEIAESEMPRLASVDDAVRFLDARLREDGTS